MTFLRSSSPAPGWLVEALPALALPGGCRFDAFVGQALYHPVFGYYRRERARVGRTSGHDFATSSSLGPLFGKLVRAAAAKLTAGAGLSPAGLHLVEIGAETEKGVFQGEPGPFASVSVLPLGSSLRLPENAVVFSNELFDAQPFRRLLKTPSGWTELHVALDEAGHLTEIPGNAAELHDDAPEGWILDLPSGAEALARELAAQRWRGLFLAFDYGREWRDLLASCPEGTARAYQRQRQHNRLLDDPGEQDLTCHVVWDHLGKALEDNRFRSQQVERQEAFFLRHAADEVARVFQQADALSSDRRSLAALLHPAHFGTRFQVLHAVRTEI